jgi:hypothetical protein
MVPKDQKDDLGICLICNGDMIRKLPKPTIIYNGEGWSEK